MPELAGAVDPLGLTAAADRRLKQAAAFMAVAVVALYLTTPLSLWDVFGAPFYYLLLPGLALAQLPLLQTTRIRRIPVYIGSAVTIVVIGAIGLALWSRLSNGIPVELVRTSATGIVAWTVVLTVAGVAILGTLTVLDPAFRNRSPTPLFDLLPRTPKEKLVFAVLSICAGLGEEVAYRGYALAVVREAGLPVWPAAVLSAAAFGVLHAYQGMLGAARTAATGFVLAIPVVVSGTILPSIVAHALVDVIGGLVIGPRLVAGSPGAPALVRRSARE